MTGAGIRSRRTLQAVLFVLFVLVPLAEIYVLVQVGQVIGAGWTILLLVADAVLGTWLIKHEGARAWRVLREALDSGRMPATELADGALILVGGTLMLAPGFLTDVVGILLILPFTRPVFRRVLGAAVARRMSVGFLDVGRPGPQTRRGPGPGPGEGPVVRGEVVDDDR
ncbi:FxsA family protein [Nocardioides sp. YIM 152315]|uniref:FxsA family protein n=1 Tax=Nocardioides sp. YIM 152315 TaxID=3031760 RepID=UPI0023DC1628|nr:FxsA family protein [Nocardioides sp. YIM 152315]MDF1602483.1 FxsA family protein [Nocardioides sp. YIM 152315]